MSRKGAGAPRPACGRARLSPEPEPLATRWEPQTILGGVPGAPVSSVPKCPCRSVPWFHPRWAAGPSLASPPAQMPTNILVVQGEPWAGTLSRRRGFGTRSLVGRRASGRGPGAGSLWRDQLVEGFRAGQGELRPGHSLTLKGLRVHHWSGGPRGTTLTTRDERFYSTRSSVSSSDLGGRDPASSVDRAGVPREPGSRQEEECPVS